MELQASESSTAAVQPPDTVDGVLDREKLRNLREERGLTMDQAAKAAGLRNRQRWYQIEAGLKPNITLDTLDRIAKALGVQAKELLK